MSSVITVMNMKGGVGKTTLTMHIGGILGNYKIKDKPRKVLLIDYDPQHNLTQAFISAKHYYNAIEPLKKTCLAILQDDISKLDPLQIQVPGKRTPPRVETLVQRISTSEGSVLDLVPSTLDLMYIALGRSEKKLDVIDERFRQFIEQCKETYDVILIDCHPAGSILTKTSLENSDHVIIPVAPHPFAVRGIRLMKQFIEACRASPDKALPHIVFNNVPRTGIASEESSIRADPRFAKYCLQHTLKRYNVFSQPAEGSKFVWQTRQGRRPYSGEAFDRLMKVTEEVVERLSL